MLRVQAGGGVRALFARPLRCREGECRRCRKGAPEPRSCGRSSDREGPGGGRGAGQCETRRGRGEGRYVARAERAHRGRAEAAGSPITEGGPRRRPGSWIIEGGRAEREGR
jgi:hypothetical protein